MEMVHVHILDTLKFFELFAKNVASIDTKRPASERITRISALSAQDKSTSISLKLKSRYIHTHCNTTVYV